MSNNVNWYFIVFIIGKQLAKGRGPGEIDCIFIALSFALLQKK